MYKAGPSKYDRTTVLSLIANNNVLTDLLFCFFFILQPLIMPDLHIDSIGPVGPSQRGKFFSNCPIIILFKIRMDPGAADDLYIDAAQSTSGWNVDFKEYVISQYTQGILFNPKNGRNDAIRQVLGESY